MLWSSEIEEPLKLRCLKIENLGYHSVPIPASTTSKWIEKLQSEEFNSHRDPDSPTLVFDPSLVKTGSPTEQRCFSESLFDLASTALKNTLNVNLESLYLNTEVSLKKVIICLPETAQSERLYKSSSSKFSAVQSGFAGTFLLQIPVEEGCTGASLKVLNQNETIKQLDLTKNSGTNAYMTLLLNSSSSSPLQYEITPPSSGAVVMMVFHYIWQDCHKLTSRLSMLPSFIGFTGKILSSMARARKSSFSTLFYIPLPQVSASDNPDSFRFKGESSDMAFAISSLKLYDILGIVSETQSRDTNGNPDSIFIHRIINPGNSFLTPTEWIGTTLQVTHIDIKEIQDEITEVIPEAVQQFGALIIPRRELLFRSCSNDLPRVIQTVEERLSRLDKSAIGCRDRSQLVYDLKIIAEYLVEQKFCIENEASIAGIKALLDCFVKLKLADTCSEVLTSFISELLPKVQNDATPYTEILKLVFIFCCRIGRREIAKPIEHLVTPSPQDIEEFSDEDVDDRILDKLISTSLPIEVRYCEFTAEQIDGMLDSLADVKPSRTVVSSSETPSKIGNFFKPFNISQVVKVLINYRTRHAAIHESFPHLFAELMKGTSRKGFKSLQDDAKALDDLLQLYVDFGDVAALAHVLVRTAFGTELFDARFELFRKILMSSVKNWADLKTLCQAIKSDDFGVPFVKRSFSKFLSRYTAANQQRKKGKSKEKKEHQALWTTLDEHQFVVRFFAFLLFYRTGSNTPPAIPYRNIEILNLANENECCLLFSGLVNWDDNGLKTDKDVLGFVTELFHAFIVRFPEKAASLYNSDTWLSIGNCVGWQADSNLAETIIKEVLKLFQGGNKKMLPKLDSAKILRGITESAMCLGRAEAKKPIVKERFIDEILELWIQLLSKVPDSSGSSQPGHIRNGIISCIAAFFRARKLNLYMPKTSPHVQLLHRIAKMLNLDNLVTMFEDILRIEVDPVRPVTKAVDAVSWRLYVSMCTWIVSSPELEPYLKTCEVKRASTLYGFALWCGNQHLLDVLNEKIISLPPLDSGGTLRELLADMPHVKRLAVDACSKEALKKLMPARAPTTNETTKEEQSTEKRKLPEDSGDAAQKVSDEASVAKKIKVEDADGGTEYLEKEAPIKSEGESQCVVVKTEPAF